ncbi:MAG: hypothetical protein PHX50_17670 [Massilibacteroides sp.]|nr:hypothetical protein [Massilibacteroides sp.]
MVDYRYVNASAGNDSNDGLTEATAWATVDFASKNTPTDGILHLTGDFINEPTNNKIYPVNTGVSYIWDSKVIINKYTPHEWDWSTWSTAIGIPESGYADPRFLSGPQYEWQPPYFPPISSPDPDSGEMGVSGIPEGSSVWASAEKTFVGTYTNLSLWVGRGIPRISGVRFKIYIDGTLKQTVSLPNDDTYWNNIIISESMVNPVIKLLCEHDGYYSGVASLLVSTLRLT